MNDHEIKAVGVAAPTLRARARRVFTRRRVPRAGSLRAARIGDFSALDWTPALPDTLAGAKLVLNVEEDATVNVDSAVDALGVEFNVADGKTLTLSGSAIAATAIAVNGGTVVVGSAGQLAGTLRGDGTVVYDGLTPTGVTFTDPAWAGVLWFKNGTRTGMLAQNLASESSTLRLTGVTGYFNNADSAMTCAGTLELVDDGETPAFTVSNGYSSNGKTIFKALIGDGTFKSITVAATATWTAPNGIDLASEDATLTVVAGAVLTDGTGAIVPTTSLEDKRVEATANVGATVYSVGEVPPEVEFDGGAEGKSFTIDADDVATLSENLPEGKTLGDASGVCGMTYAQAYALGLFDVATGEVAPLHVSITVEDGEVTVVALGDPEAAYVVTTRLQYRTSLVEGEWADVLDENDDPVEDEFGEDLVDPSALTAQKFYRVVVTVEDL